MLLKSCDTVRVGHVHICFHKTFDDAPGLTLERRGKASAKRDRLRLQFPSTETPVKPFRLAVLPSPLSSQEEQDGP